MKWFKHQASARNDERIARLEDKAGLEGYGFYFKMLEIVAEVIDGTDRCEVTYSLSRWGRQSNISTKKFMTLVQCCSDVGLMLVQRAGDDMTVKIPNLLKYRDNHTKNLQAACKQEVEEETEIEQKKKEQNPAPKKPARFDPLSIELPECLKPEIWSEWISYRRGRNLTTRQATMVAQVVELAGWFSAGHDPTKIIQTSIAKGWAGLFEPKQTNAPPKTQNDERIRIAEAIWGKQNGRSSEIHGTAERVD